MHRFRRRLWTTALIGACVLLPPSPTFATVVRESSADGTRDDSVPETGGHRVIPPGPLHLKCTQFGREIAEGRQLERLAVSPSNVLGWFSFQRRGDRGRTIIMPVGDGLTTCTLSQEPAP